MESASASASSAGVPGRSATRVWFRERVKGCLCRAASCGRFSRPIFILAPPRSGSSLLFECLTRFDGIVHLSAEADLYWWRLFPSEGPPHFSDFVSRDQIDPRSARALCRSLYRAAVISQLRKRRGRINPLHLLGVTPIRYLDKTIANCFHLEALDLLFPDAQYVFLVRDPRANIASMIEGWPHLERFGKPQLTPILQGIRRRNIEHWTYPAPPGWQEVVHRPLPEICAWIWQQHVEAVLGFIERKGRSVVRLRYEDLTSEPTATVRRLAHELDLPWSEAVARYTREMPLSRTVVSSPDPDKWKRRFADEIRAVLPGIRATAERVGYEPAAVRT